MNDHEFTHRYNTFSKIFNSDIGNVRVLGTFENPLFVAKDIYKILGNKTERTYEKDTITFKDFETRIPNQTYNIKKLRNNTILINRWGVYNLIHSSKKDYNKIHTFKKWLNKHILPNIKELEKERIEYLKNILS